MYHEITEAIYQDGESTMTPMYYIPISMFEEQLNYLGGQGYKSLVFEDVSGEKEDGKYVILTFDDGLKGNFKCALPILKKYGFKAVIFITVGRIGENNYMNWAEIEQMAEHGMSIQSHTMTHKPLQTLKDDEIYEELQMSKEIIEKKLDTKVSALSFPHGSYNKKVILIAQKAGYKYMCTSNLERVYFSSFQNSFAVLGRITMSNKMDLNKFKNLVEYNRYNLLAERLKKQSKNALKRMIGIENYRRLYRKYFNIKLS